MGYKGVKPIEEQIITIADIFGLNPAYALDYAKNLPPLDSFVPAVSLERAGYFAVIHDCGFVNSDAMYRNTLQFMIRRIGELRAFWDWNGSVYKDYLRISARTRKMMNKITTQKGDILIIAAQLGEQYIGRSVRDVRASLASNEFGLGAVQIESIILTHPEWGLTSNPGIDCPGDETIDVFNRQFVNLLCFRFFEDKVIFGETNFDNESKLFGSATAFLW